jgi:hypothetical protein
MGTPVRNILDTTSYLFPTFRNNVRYLSSNSRRPSKMDSKRQDINNIYFTRWQATKPELSIWLPWKRYTVPCRLLLNCLAATSVRDPVIRETCGQLELFVLTRLYEGLPKNSWNWMPKGSTSKETVKIWVIVRNFFLWSNSPNFWLDSLFNLLKPASYMMYQQVSKSTVFRSVHAVLMFFLFIWEWAAICATYSINRSVFITEMKTVYCGEWSGPFLQSVHHL